MKLKCIDNNMSYSNHFLILGEAYTYLREDEHHYYLTEDNGRFGFYKTRFKKLLELNTEIKVL